MKSYLFFCALGLLITGCKTKNVNTVVNDQLESKFEDNKNQFVQTGNWVFQLALPGKPDLNFNFRFESQSSGVLINAEEEIKINDISIVKDSIFIKLPIFDSEFKGVLSSSSSISGKWFNYAKGKNYSIAFRANVANNRYICPHVGEQSDSFKDHVKWEVTFSPGTDDAYKAIGVFKNNNGRLTGTFITETGDYRFLEGIQCGPSFVLSCFDGAHAFLFTGHLNDTVITNGMFYSGHHWEEPWEAKQNNAFQLTDPYMLTYIKEGHEGFKFSFLDTDSNLVVFPSKQFENKVTLVQIMGSWCPNCMDETVLLSKMHNEFNKAGLEIISLCFEKADDFSGAKKNIERLKNRVGAKYTFLHAGPASKASANDSLPMLNHVMSFPTAIFIDKKGRVRKIHTGFYGPGTGDYHAKTVDEFYADVKLLLSE